MNFQRTIFLPGLLALLFCIPMALLAKDKVERSGYLGDDIYARLESVEIHEDVTAERWIGPRLSFANFQNVLIDDVIFYPEPETGPQVSEETLQAIRDYITSNLKSKVGKVLKVADAPGPGVLQLQAAITGVEIKTESMKAYEVVPVAAVFGGFKALTGKRDRDVHVFVEVKMLDSQSGEVVGAVVRKIEGQQLKGKKDMLELEDMTDSLDGAADDASNALSGMLSGK